MEVLNFNKILLPKLFQALIGYSEDPSEMLHNASFHLGLHCLPNKTIQSTPYFGKSNLRPLDNILKTYNYLVAKAELEIGNKEASITIQIKDQMIMGKWDYTLKL